MKQRLIRRWFAAFLALWLAGGFSFGADGGRKESARFFGISEAGGEEAAEAAPVEVLPVEESVEPVQIESFEQTENPEQKSSAGENSPVQSGSSGQGALREESGAPVRDSGGNESGDKNIEESAGGKEKAGTEGSGSSGESQSSTTSVRQGVDFTHQSSPL